MTMFRKPPFIRCLMIGFGLTALPIGLSAPADAQYYNPSHYNSTRNTMNYRAAARAAARRAELRRYCRAHPRAARCRGRVVRKR